MLLLRSSLLFIPIILLGHCSKLTSDKPQIIKLHNKIDALEHTIERSQINRSNELKSTLFTVNDIGLADIDQGQTTSLSNISKDNEYTFIFHFTEYCCMQCVNTYIEILDMITASSPSSKVAIISNYSDVKLLKIKKLEQSINTKCYNTNEFLDLPINDTTDTDRPFMFLMDNNLKVHFPKVGTVPDSLNTVYFERILSHLSD